MTPELLNEQLTQADVETRKGNYDIAEQVVNEVIDTLNSFETLSSVTAEIKAKAILALAWIDYKKGQYNSALENGNTMLAIANEYFLTELKPKVWNLLGAVNRSLGFYHKALEYFEEGLAISKELGQQTAIATLTGNIGSVFQSLGSYDKSLVYFESALNSFSNLGNISGVAHYHRSIGEVYSFLGYYNKALEYYEKALVIHQEIGEKSNIAHINSSLGIIHHRLGMYDKALEYYEEALAVHQELGVKSGVAFVTGNIGAAYHELKQYENALEYEKNAHALAEDIGDRRLVGCFLVSIGSTLSAMGKKEDALEYLRKGLNLRRNELNSQSEIVENLLAIGSIVVDQNKHEEALEVFTEALTLADELGVKGGSVSAHQSLATLYEKLHNPIKELEHFKLYHTLEKEVLSEEAKKKAEHIEQLKRIAEREKEIEIAKASANAKLSATTSLLHRVLPESIASRILAGEEQIADFFPNVSILFADMVGFTTIATDVPPDIIVALLNHVFDIFDQIMKKHGCEKVKTMGDGYMAVAGAPIECKDHAERIARAALDMMADIRLPEGITEFLPSGTRFQIRIGIHTGGAVCGVMGRDRFIWDVYSDAVNIASRMESSGVAGKIQVSKDFVRYMKSRAKTGGEDEFTFSERGEMEIKGKGMMKTYFMEKV